VTGTGDVPAYWGFGLGFDGAGTPVVTTYDPNGASLVAVDPVTGDRTEISGPSVGGGPALQGLVDVVFAPPQDQDGDGLTDLFEVTHGLDPLVGGEENLDADGDGLDTLAEQAAGTDPGNPDTDGDGHLDGSDNCPVAANPGQADFDGDGEGDVCDLNDGRLRIISVSPSQVEWEPEPATYDGYNVYRGDLETLVLTGEYSQPGSVPEAESYCGQSGNVLADSFLPAPGQGVFYLVAGTLGGVEGTDPLGVDSSGAPRVHSNPCPVP
jgi:hypothetical protein